MSNFLKYLDFYSQSLIFTYKGRKSIRTIWGGIISIISVVTILLNALIIGKDIYFKDNPTVVQSEKNENEIQIDRFSLKENTLAFAFHTPINGTYWDESVIQFIPSITIGKLDENKKIIFREYFLEMTDCREEYERLNKTMDIKVLNIAKCIKNLDMYIAGDLIDDFFSELTVDIRTCRNKTSEILTNAITDEENASLDKLEKNFGELYNNKNNLIDEGENFNFYNYLRENRQKITKKNIICKPQKEIEKIVEGLNVYILYDEVSFNPKNYNDPINKYPVLNQFTIGNSLSKFYKYYFQSNSVITDAGIIFKEDYQDTHKIAIKNSKYDFVLKNPEDSLIGYFQFFNTKKNTILHREYIKIQNIFANLGGFINLTKIFFVLISIPFFEKKIKLKIVNELFDISDKITLDSLNDKKINIFENENKDKLSKKEINIELPIKDISDNKVQINSRNNQIGLNLVNFVKINDNKNEENLNKEENLKNEGNLKNSNFMKIDISSRSLNNEEPQKIVKFLEENDQKKDTELEKKINKIYKYLMNKIKFTSWEIFRSSYFLFCCNENLKRKNLSYELAIKDIHKGTDYLETIKLHKNFKILQFLLLDKQQIKMFPFISNPKKFEKGYDHDFKDYAEIFSPNYDIKEDIWKTQEYFENKLENENLDKIDNKLWGIIHPKIKKLFDHIE